MSLNLDHLVKLLGMTGSSSDGELVNALRMAPFRRAAPAGSPFDRRALRHQGFRPLPVRICLHAGRLTDKQLEAVRKWR